MNNTNVFKGHQIVKLINDNWVFDFTDYVGYHVDVEDNKIKNIKVAFTTTIVDDIITFDKKCRVPVKVLKEANRQIQLYQTDMEESDEQFRSCI